jgi:hypothetical protein
VSLHQVAFGAMAPSLRAQRVQLGTSHSQSHACAIAGSELRPPPDGIFHSSVILIGLANAAHGTVSHNRRPSSSSVVFRSSP